MQHWFLQQQLWLQLLLGVAIVLVAAAALWMIFSVVLLPLIALIQKAIEPAENSTSMSDDHYLWGTLTLPVDQTHTGEVMITGGGNARQVYSAKLWPGASKPLAKGQKVLVVEVKGGIAFVQELELQDK